MTKPKPHCKKPANPMGNNFVFASNRDVLAAIELIKAAMTNGADAAKEELGFTKAELIFKIGVSAIRNVLVNKYDKPGDWDKAIIEAIYDLGLPVKRVEPGDLVS